MGPLARSISSIVIKFVWIIKQPPAILLSLCFQPTIFMIRNKNVHVLKDFMTILYTMSINSKRPIYQLWVIKLATIYFSFRIITNNI